MKVDRVRGAQRELVDAVRWYRTRSATAPDRFLADFDRTVDRIVASPRLPAPMAGGFRSRFMTSFPYQVVYRIEHDTIRIYAVAHFKRRAAYWRRRVPP
jgi:plasmid stabilization system protein ParE